MPAMDFRRDFTAISGLSVVLVVVSSVLLGLFFSWVIPDLSLAWGIALGAIVSPTDAVATSIVKGLGVSPRAVAILEGLSHELGLPKAAFVAPSTSTASRATTRAMG